MKVSCPTCQNDVEWNSTATYRPFCSKRCQMIDLGEWADEKNTIKGQTSQQLDELSDEALEALISSLENH